METMITDALGIKKWPWYRVREDLGTQAGLTEISVYPTSEIRNSYTGYTKSGIHFFMNWIPGMGTVVFLRALDSEFIDALSVVLEYRPSLGYIESNGLYAVEWIKMNKEKERRFLELQIKGVRELKKIQ